MFTTLCKVIRSLCSTQQLSAGSTIFSCNTPLTKKTQNNYASNLHFLNAFLSIPLMHVANNICDTRLHFVIKLICKTQSSFQSGIWMATPLSAMFSESIIISSLYCYSNANTILQVPCYGDFNFNSWQCFALNTLTHWNRVTRVCIETEWRAYASVNKASIFSQKYLSLVRRQDITCTDGCVLFIGQFDKMSVKFTSKYKHLQSRK